MLSSSIIRCLVCFCLFIASLHLNAEPRGKANTSSVIINGHHLSITELHQLQQQLGSVILPGIYYYDAQSTCWINTTSGAKGCLKGQQYTTRYGSGEWDSQGNWSHYSSVAGGAVGGSSDGCVYAFGWSNC